MASKTGKATATEPTMNKHRPLTRKAVEKILRATPEDSRPTVLCGLVGHSRFTTFCFGYLNCARCSAQRGDTLGSGTVVEGIVVEGHLQNSYDGCDCRDVAMAVTWRDVMFVDDLKRFYGGACPGRIRRYLMDLENKAGAGRCDGKR